MTPDEKKISDQMLQVEESVKDLGKTLEDMRGGTDNVFSETLKRRFLQTVIQAGILDTTLTDINHTTVVGAGGGSVQHAQVFDRRLRVEIDGQPYYLGLYDA